MTAELNNTNQLTTDEMTVDTDASHTTPRHLTRVPTVGVGLRCVGGGSLQLDGDQSALQRIESQQIACPF